MTADRPSEVPPDLLARVVAGRDRVRERIRSAGGDPDAIEVVAVTKRFPADAVRAAAAAGFTRVGENYAQELLDKVEALIDDPPTVRWHMIGGLQRNKVKRLAGLDVVYGSVDRERLVDEIAARDPGATVHVQVNTTDEDAKSGCDPSAAPALVERARAAGLVVEALMTMGPTDGSDPRPAFDRLVDLADECGVDGRSMGMSGDLEAAVGAGTTIVRVGSALFGPRPTTLDAAG